MAKKMVRGITDVKTINNQDYDTNNVNDLLSDGQYNYIHRQKGKTEEYHNLTDNIKTISSDNTELLSVTNNNKTTNTATLSPKHDKQKEQVLESTRDTVTIQHGSNGTAEKTSVDTNPQKVLEHENLISDSEYITLSHQTGENTTHIQAVKLKEKLDELEANKQDVLIAGSGITINGQTISASAPTSNIEFYYAPEWLFRAFKQVVTNGDYTFVTFTFECDDAFAKRELTGNIKNELEKFVRSGMTVSNGSISISNDGTTMKLIDSAPPKNGNNQGTFTFFDGTITG